MAENTIIHEISLAGYKATSTGGMLDLGTWGSYGIEKLHLTLDAAWQDLTITAFFNVNGKVVAKRVVGKDGYADAETRNSEWHRIMELVGNQRSQPCYYRILYLRHQ